VKGVLADCSAKNRLSVVHAGSEDGFVTGAQLMFSTKQDQGPATATAKLMLQIWKKWIQEKLIPNLPEKSVVVFDNAPYLTIQVDKPSFQVRSKGRRDFKASETGDCL